MDKILHAHCSHCKGIGPNMDIVKIKSPGGTVYRIPVNHISCIQALTNGCFLFDPDLYVKQQEVNTNEPNND